MILWGGYDISKIVGHHHNPNLKLILNFGKIQMRFQDDLGPIVQPLLYEEIVLAKMLRN